MIIRSYRLSVVCLCAVAALFVGCCPTIVILPQALPNGVGGLVYVQTLTANGPGRQVWHIDSGELPAGLALDESTGVIQGTPAETGDFEFVVEVYAGLLPPCRGAIPYTLTILEPLTIDANVPAARIDEPYSHAFSPSGGVLPYTSSLIGLPAGLGFDPNTAILSGTPQVSRIEPYTIRVTIQDSGEPQQTLVKDLPLKIKGPPVQITTESLPDGEQNTPYNAQLEADGGLLPLEWRIAAGTVLPPGLTISDQVNGVISGIPTATGTFAFTVEAEDSDTPPTSMDTKELSITVN